MAQASVAYEAEEPFRVMRLRDWEQQWNQRLSEQAPAVVDGKEPGRSRRELNCEERASLEYSRRASKAQEAVERAFFAAVNEHGELVAWQCEPVEPAPSEAQQKALRRRQGRLRQLVTTVVLGAFGLLLFGAVQNEINRAALQSQATIAHEPAAANAPLALGSALEASARVSETVQAYLSCVQRASQGPGGRCWSLMQSKP